MRNLIIYLSITAALLCSCSPNVKPDNAQVYDSFKKRRAVKENSTAMSGGMIEKKPVTSNTASFSPIIGSPVNLHEKNSQTLTSKANTPKNTNLTQNVAPYIAPYGVDSGEVHGSKSMSERLKNKVGLTANQETGQKSFFERLKTKFNTNNSQSANQDSSTVIFEKGSQDSQLDAEDDLLFMKQNSGSSVYDSAEPITGPLSQNIYIPDSYSIASLSLFDAPKARSEEELINASEQLQEPKLQSDEGSNSKKIG